MAHACVEGVTGKNDALGFELGASGSDIVRGLPFCATKGIPTSSGSQMPKQVEPAHCSYSACGSGRRPRVFL